MKTSYTYLYLFFLCFLAASCSNDDNDPAATQILKSDVLFEAKGGTGTIELSTDQFKAVSDQEWCTIQPEGSIIKVSVPQNTDIGGRTALITITTRDTELEVPVTQKAPVFIISSTDPLSFFGNDQKIELQVESSLSITVQSDAEWLKCQQKDNSLIFSCTKSDVPLRTTQVKVTSGSKIVTLDCSQTCIEGDYLFTYSTASWDDVALNATLTKDPAEENAFILKGDLPYGREFKLKYENGKLAFHAGQYLGKETIEGNEYHIFLTLGYGRLVPAWDSVVDYVAPMEVDKQGNYFFEFVDGKHWGKYFCTRLSISTFTSDKPSESTYIEEVEKMQYVIMKLVQVR